MLSWLSRAASALNPPHVHLQVILVVLPLPSPAHTFKSAFAKCFQLQTQCPGGMGWQAASQPNPRAGNTGQAAILGQRRPGNPDSLRCMNGWFVQPSPACLRKARAACLLCNSTENRPGMLRASPHQVNQLQGGWAHIASKKLSRVPVSHPEAFLNREKIAFSWM